MMITKSRRIASCCAAAAIALAFLPATAAAVGGSDRYSYGGDDDYGRDLALYPNDYTSNLQFGQIEVFTVSAVPEPETWALMLAGLGVLGCVARHRA